MTKKTRALAWALTTVLCGSFLLAAPAHAELSAEELAKLAQNPVGNLVSVPFQNNTNLNFGPDKRTQNILNIQPVIPVSVNEDWNIITAPSFRSSRSRSRMASAPTASATRCLPPSCRRRNRAFHLGRRAGAAVADQQQLGSRQTVTGASAVGRRPAPRKGPGSMAPWSTTSGRSPTAAPAVRTTTRRSSPSSTTTCRTAST